MESEKLFCDAVAPTHQRRLCLNRPKLSRALGAAEFARWYWLKTELVDFCRELGVSAQGSKPEIATRILAELRGEPVPKLSPWRLRGHMPASFTRRTIIGEGWSCNPRLGKFFRAECGRTFRFNAAIRSFIHTQVGESLAAAIACYRASATPGAPPQALAPQLEYNRHTREFYRDHPGATSREVIAAWRQRRSRPTD